MSTKKQKKEYSDDFKKEVLLAWEMSDKPIGEFESEMGISHGLIRKWEKRFRVNHDRNELELNELEQLKQEVRALKRELEVTRMERDILKKTVGIFSKDQRR